MYLVAYAVTAGEGLLIDYGIVEDIHFTDIYFDAIDNGCTVIASPDFHDTGK